MSVYAAFLRGLNLGPSNKIAMARLKELAEGLGWSDVTTYINSGNLVFSSRRRPATLERELGAAVAAELGKKQIDVAVRTRDQLAELVAANPWPDGHPSRVNVAFLMAELPAATAEALAAHASADEAFVLRAREIYVHYTNGLGRSKLAEKFSSVVRVSTTTRTIGTVTKVLRLTERVGG